MLPDSQLASFGEYSTDSVFGSIMQPTEGAQPDVRRDDGYTALAYASYNGHGDVVALLLDAGQKKHEQ